jgi:DNA-binding winged helix-turn-helix (wHTH) protein
MKNEAVDLTEHEGLRAALDQKETALRLVSSQIPLISWATDAALKFTSSTGSGLPLVDLEEGQVVGTTLPDFLGDDETSLEPVAASRRALEGETVSFEIEWAGHCFTALVGPRYDKDGAIIGTTGVAVDQTRQLDLESQVRMLTEELARLRRAIREGSTITMPDTSSESEPISVNVLEIEPDNYVVKRSGEEISLTPIEFRLLVELAKNPNKVLSRAILLERVWGYDFMGGAAVVNMAIRRLREKVELDASEPSLIQTVRGVGYRLVDD